MPRHRPARAAFTLVELLIVVVIIAIAAAIVLPSTGGSDEARVRAAARLLADDLAFAQMSSIGRAADPCIVVFDVAGSTYHVARTSDTATPIDDPVTADAFVTAYGTGRAAHLPGISIDSVDLDGDESIGFDHLGMPDQAADATVTLRCGASTIVVTIDADTGEATSPDPA